MSLTSIDIGIIIVYIIVMIAVGFWLSKKASENIDGYFLGGRSMSWYILGLASAAGSFDVAGTMWFVYIIFVYGMKGVWLPWMWPTFIAIFLMVFLAKWTRRSGVMTGAEWLKTRFGEDKGARLSHLSITLFAIVATVAFLSYAFVGIGKFAATFLPWDLSPQTYGIILVFITTLYTVLGGMYSVVITDVLQWCLLTISSVIIAVIVWVKVSPEQIYQATPEGWDNIFFSWRLNLDWSPQIAAVNDAIATDGWTLFGAVVMMMVIKGILVSLAGVAPNFDMQRILACRNPRESSLMNLLISIALAPRWLMIGGVAVLGLVYGGEALALGDASMDFERILPYVMNNFIPPGGLLGILLAGLLAAFMSTFSATLNAGSAYVVNDIYKRYINPNASEKQYVIASYLASSVLVGIGIFFGLMTTSINQAMQLIVSGLYAGYAAPNILKWYWWRFNGLGYFWGMISGLAATLGSPYVYNMLGGMFPGCFSGEFSPLYGFPFIIGIPMVVSIAVSLLTKPDDENVLKEFYRKVRPWGFWGPIYEKVKQDHPDFEKNRDFCRDTVNVLVGTIWQLMLVTLPLYLILQNPKGIIISIVILMCTSVFLKYFWYDHLTRENQD